jgi:hypothetical protein
MILLFFRVFFHLTSLNKYNLVPALTENEQMIVLYQSKKSGDKLVRLHCLLIAIPKMPDEEMKECIITTTKEENV